MRCTIVCAVCLLDEGGVFKSKKTTRYAADEIQETWETKTDLPLDQRRAEEVEVVIIMMYVRAGSVSVF